MIASAYCLLHPFRFLAHLCTKDIHINAEYTRGCVGGKVCYIKWRRPFLAGVCVCVCVRARALVAVVSDSFATPWTIQLARLLCPQNFPGKNTGVGSYSLHCRQILYHLSHQGSPGCHGKWNYQKVIENFCRTNYFTNKCKEQNSGACGSPLKTSGLRSGPSSPLSSMNLNSICMLMTPKSLSLV